MLVLCSHPKTNESFSPKQQRNLNRPSDQYCYPSSLSQQPAQLFVLAGRLEVAGQRQKRHGKRGHNRTEILDKRTANRIIGHRRDRYKGAHNEVVCVVDNLSENMLQEYPEAVACKVLQHFLAGRTEEYFKLW